MKSGARGHEPWLAAAAICAAGLFLRLAGIGRPSFWFDEASTLLAARLPFGAPWPLVEPPLFTWLMKAWLALPFGGSEAFARLPAALLSAACLPLVYVVAKEWLKPGGALLALALAAVSPFEIIYAQEARMYSGLVFFSLVST